MARFAHAAGGERPLERLEEAVRVAAEESVAR
jgi:hypothetical protein